MLIAGNHASTNPMQVLEVMARVVGEAEPHVMPPVEVILDLVEGDIEVIVPLSKMVEETISLASVYALEETKELITLMIVLERTA